MTQRQFNHACIALKRTDKGLLTIVLVSVAFLSVLIGAYASTPRIIVIVTIPDQCFKSQNVGSNIGSLVAIDASGQHKLSRSVDVTLKSDFTLKYLPTLDCPAKAGLVRVGPLFSSNTYQMVLMANGTLSLTLNLAPNIYTAEFLIEGENS